MKKNHQAPTLTQLEGDALEQQKLLPSKSVQMCLTSLPYYGLRDYGIKNQLGLEDTPEEYLKRAVDIFRETYRVLRDDGILWLNVGDTYASTHSCGRRNAVGLGACDVGQRQNRRRNKNIKDKDLLGIPWRLALALQQPYYTGTLTEYERIWLASRVEATGMVMYTGIQRFRPEPRHFSLLEEEGQMGMIEEIYPHLTEKKQAARFAWNHLRIERERITKKTVEQLRWLKDRISEHNQGTEFTREIPKWVEPVPSLFEPGWYLRCDIIWHKTNPCPEGAKDRPTKTHEYIFMMTKKAKYKYNAEAIMEVCSPNTHPRLSKKREAEIIAARAANDPEKGKATVKGKATIGSFQVKNNEAFAGSVCLRVEKRHKRSVWSAPVAKSKEAHFATFSPELIIPCILAGSDPGDTILDNFSGTGTTGRTSMENGRKRHPDRHQARLQ